MTKQDLESLINAARSDKVYLRKCVLYLDEALKDKGLSLSQQEKNWAEKELDHLYQEIFSVSQTEKISSDPNELINQETQRRVIDITLNLLQNAIEDARIAFRNLRLLSNLTFAVGLSLFILSAVSGLVLQKETFSLVFGGLGASLVVAIFITKPKEEIQIALSNLLQAETIFLDFYDQVHFWAPFAVKGSMDERKQASQALNDAASFALQSLQQYVEHFQNRPQINKPPPHK